MSDESNILIVSFLPSRIGRLSWQLHRPFHTSHNTRTSVWKTVQLSRARLIFWYQLVWLWAGPQGPPTHLNLAGYKSASQPRGPNIFRTLPCQAGLSCINFPPRCSQFARGNGREDPLDRGGAGGRHFQRERRPDRWRKWEMEKWLTVQARGGARWKFAVLHWML